MARVPSNGGGWFFGKLASQVAAILGTQPLLLAVVCLNALLLWLIYLGQQDTRDHYDTIIQALIRVCK